MNPNEQTKQRGLPAAAAPGGARLTAERKGRRAIPSRKWEKYRRRLLALRSHLEAKRRNHALAARETLECFSMDMADAATDEFDHALALSELSSEQAALYEIDEALARIESGTYGICEITGKPIPESRLNVLPWTRFSGAVERRLEREGEIRRPQLGKPHSVTGRLRRELSESASGEETATPSPNDETLVSRKSPNRHLKAE
jgi:DnaK suppressor protein